MVAAIEPPPISDKTKFEIQNKLEFPAISKLVNVPVPEGIVEPLKLKPITVVEPAETIKPAASAAPPEALIPEAPSILN